MSDVLDLPRALLPGAGRRLVVYGTLAPGAENHGWLAGCRGVWRPGFVRGRRAVRAWPVFTCDLAAPPVAVQWFESGDLPARWRALDAFEGDDYRRVLAPVWDAGGRLVTVANLYEARLPVGARPPAR